MALYFIHIMVQFGRDKKNVQRNENIDINI